MPYVALQGTRDVSLALVEASPDPERRRLCTAWSRPLWVRSCDGVRFTFFCNTYSPPATPRQPSGCTVGTGTQEPRGPDTKHRRSNQVDQLGWDGVASRVGRNGEFSPRDPKGAPRYLLLVGLGCLSEALGSNDTTVFCRSPGVVAQKPGRCGDVRESRPRVSLVGACNARQASKTSISLETETE